MKKILYIVTLIIIINLSFAEKVDSTLNVILNNKNISSFEFKKILELVASKQEGLDSNTFEYLYKIKSIMDENKFSEFNGEFSLLMGKYWRVSKEFNLAFEYINKAIEFYKDKNDNFNLILSVLAKAETFRAEAKINEALEEIKNAENLLKEDNKILIAKIENRKAAIIYQLKNKISKDSLADFLDNNLKIALKSFQISKEINNYDLLINNYNIIGSIYRDKLDYKKAEEYLYKAVTIMNQYPDSSFSLYQMNNVLWNLAKTYIDSKDDLKAIAICKKIIDFTNAKGVKYDNVTVYSYLAEAYTHKGDYKTANYYLNLKYNEYTKFISENKVKVALDLQEKYNTIQKEKELERNKISTLYQQFAFILIISAAIFFIFYFIRKHKLQKENNEIVQLKNIELSQLNATKDKFFSIIAHDLKNPLSSMITSADMLANNHNEIDDEEKLELSKELHQSSEQLMRLLENLLTWSRSQRDLINVHEENFDILALIQNNISLCNHLAHKKSIALKNELKANLIIYSDLNIISTILRNLTTNAIKFTPFGGIVRFNAYISPDNKGELCISIKDNGIGMNQEKIDSLFVVGKNKSTEGTNFEKGTGLGLILCKEFIDKIGGRIIVESSPGKGSNFICIIPILEK